VVTDRGRYEADFLVVALGADYDIAATPGLAEGGNEFYSVAGAARLNTVLAGFKGGHAVVAVLGQPFKCPPAPSETAFLLHDYLAERGVREGSSISLVSPFGRPIPPSPDGSAAILEGFRERGIEYLPDRTVARLDPGRKVAVLSDGEELPYDLFLGVPIHRVPEVVERSGLAEDGWIPVDNANLRTRFEGVYAAGDVTSAPVPKAGVFAERAARVVAADIVARIHGSEPPRPFDGSGICYVEMGTGRVGRIDADFLSGPAATAPFTPPSERTRAEKSEFASVRRKLWFGA